jgi:hypothetical protein
MPNINRMTDAEMVMWLGNIIAVGGANPDVYGLTHAQIADLTAKRDDLQASMSLRATADDAAKAAFVEQRTNRVRANTLASYLNISVKINPNVTTANKEAIGIAMPKPPSKTPPVRPEDLTAKGFEDARNVLRWKRAGNKPKTQFIVECKRAGETDFEYLATTTETKYEHRGATPGERCAFRVKAQRGGEESTYSNEASVY